MAISKWIASTRSGNATGVTILDTGLNALANDAGVVSATVANDTVYDMYADFELVCTHGVAPVADRTWDIYLVREVDGTNFEDASATRPPAGGFVGSFVLDAVTTIQRKVVPGAMLPPRDFKVLLVNKSGQAAAATGHTLKAFFYNQSVI